MSNLKAMSGLAENTAGTNPPAATNRQNALEALGALNRLFLLHSLSASEAKLAKRILIRALLLWLAAGWPPPVSAQDFEDNRGSLDAFRLGLTIPPDLRSKNRRAAKDGGWSFATAATSGVGFESNLHHAPTRERSAATFPLGATLETRHYFSDDDRIKVSALALGQLHTEQTQVDEHEQRIDVFYSHRFARGTSLSFSGRLRHENDHVTNIDGDKLSRDFERLDYRTIAAFWYRVADDHSLRVSYSAQRRDYSATPGLNSLDWVRHGPELRYRADLEWARLDLSYSFLVQDYDSELASSRSGRDEIGNPNEHHFFHRAGLKLSFEPMDGVAVEIGYGFKAKDDRFRSFESYRRHRVSGEITANPLARLQLQIAASYEQRNYAHRVGPRQGVDLEYDKWTAGIGVRYALTPSTTLFSAFETQQRDSNRNPFDENGNRVTGYRDYIFHEFLVGATIAF